MDALKAAIGHNFKNELLLWQALVHRSYVNEARAHNAASYERLEFLGDAVLELIVTDYLFDQYPLKPEGQLTAMRSFLVNGQTCCRAARSLGVDSHLILSKGERSDDRNGRARDSILADVFEAIIGAVYLDAGFSVAEEFVHRVLISKIEKGALEGDLLDAKSRFQESSQAQGKGTPMYRVIGTMGPQHQMTFVCGVYLGGVMIAEGQGPSKPSAEMAAAETALRLNTMG